MSSRSELIEDLREQYAAMKRCEDAYFEYITARDAASTAFCFYSNTFGFENALSALKEAKNGKH